MAEYKKRNVKKQNKRIKNAINNDIKMTPAKKIKSKSHTEAKPQKSAKPSSQPTHKKIRVIKGGKKNFKRLRLLLIGILICLIGGIVLSSCLLPTGLYDYLQNMSAISGSGSGFPQALSGGNISNILSSQKYFLIASDTNVVGYNIKGKNIFSYQHGYEIPVIKSSKTRFLIYSQGSVDFGIYNYKKNLKTAQTANPILAAAVSDSGYYALATQSDSYASQLTVYNNKHEQVYQWFCSDYIINDVILSDNGKSVAVSVFNAQNGFFNSRIYILGYSSATPEKIIEYNNDLITALKSYNNKGFFAIFENKAEHISWHNFSAQSYTFENNVIFARGTEKYSLIATCREANIGDNTVYVFDNKGSKLTSFDFENEIRNITVKGKYIYILGDRKIFLYSVGGELLNETDCDFGVEH
ncbi:MAG: hypothetical protein KBS52_05220, partial [Clostridiales bacterium]|nr:hypothetical protein [Candidatus Equinaster intestinalis]